MNLNFVAISFSSINWNGMPVWCREEFLAEFFGESRIMDGKNFRLQPNNNN